MVSQKNQKLKCDTAILSQYCEVDIFSLTFNNKSKYSSYPTGGPDTDDDSTQAAFQQTHVTPALGNALQSKYVSLFKSPNWNIYSQSKYGQEVRLTANAL